MNTMEIKRVKLTEQDIKELKYQCRMGYILPILIFIIGSVIAIALLSIHADGSVRNPQKEQLILIMGSLAAIAIFLNYRMNRNYMADIKNGLKDQELKTVQKKDHNIEYMGGTGTVYEREKKSAYDAYSIVVDNTSYRIGKDVYDNCEEGGKVVFSYAARSRYLIDIEPYKK